MLNRSFARARQGGVTLIELMVGLSVGAIVVVGLLVAWSVFVQQNDYLLRSARLNQEVRAIFQVVTQDLRRAVSPVGASAVELVCLDAASGCDPGAAVPEIGDCVVFNTNVDQSDVVDVVVTVPAGYRVRNGVVGEAVKGATLIGDGATALRQIRAIGNDMALDPGIGNCGKAGQWVPVGVGQPTLLIGGLTVGGQGG